MSNIKNVEWFLRFWGGAEEAIAQEIGTAKKVFWFATEAERDAMVARIRKFQDLGLMMDLQHGEMTHKRTVASVVFEHNSHIYVTQNDFGYEYPKSAVHYMYEDGNYSCDCNRSAFIQAIDPAFPELECGSEIKLVNLQVALLE